jgi:hypothetical protein
VVAAEQVLRDQDLVHLVRAVGDAQSGWRELRADRDGRVFRTDGNQYFNRPGPRRVESLEILAEILHPGAFPGGHRGTGWEPYPRSRPSRDGSSL